MSSDPLPEPDNLLLILIIIILLTLLNGFFAMAEIAIITLKESKLKKMAESGNKRAKLLQKLVSNPSGFFATIQVGVTIAGLLSSAVAANAFTLRLSSLLEKIHIPGSIAQGISIVLITLILSFFTLVFGELIPKTVALHKYETVAYLSARPLAFIAFIAKPAIKLLSFTTNGILHIFGLPNIVNRASVSEEEIRSLLDESGEKGVIEESQRDMIDNIFEFDDVMISEIMTHRTEVSAIQYDKTIEDLKKIAIEEGYSRIPVYKEDLDSIIGIIYVKDLLQYVGEKDIDNLTLTDIMRPAFFVPESKRCVELFRELSDKKLSMAVVVDEYGGTAGIITMEDLLEFIVGNIQDEYDDEEEEISQVTENTFTVEGTTPIYEVAHMLEIDLPEGEYDTIGGLLLDKLGYIPEPGDNPTVVIDGYSFTVLSVSDRRIDKIWVVKNDEEPAPEPTE